MRFSPCNVNCVHKNVPLFVYLCVICLSRLGLPIIMTSKIQLNPKGSHTCPCISVIKDRMLHHSDD